MKWLMRINQPVRLTASEVTDSDFSDILFTTVEFRSIYNQMYDWTEYQYKPFGEWETYFKLTREMLHKLHSIDWLVIAELLAHSLPVALREKRYYKVERIN